MTYILFQFQKVLDLIIILSLLDISKVNFLFLKITFILFQFQKVLELMNSISENTEGFDESTQQQLDKIMEESGNNPSGLRKISHLIILDRGIFLFKSTTVTNYCLTPNYIFIFVSLLFMSF